jgi:hypothetical protein
MKILFGTCLCPSFVSFGSERFLLDELFAVRGDFPSRIEVWRLPFLLVPGRRSASVRFLREHSDHRQGFVLFLESTVAVVIPFLFPLPVTQSFNFNGFNFACCVVIPRCFF